jgi:hypothetical protein
MTNVAKKRSDAIKYRHASTTCDFNFFSLSEINTLSVKWSKTSKDPISEILTWRFRADSTERFKVFKTKTEIILLDFLLQ